MKNFRNILKTFHVKHFSKVPGQNLTSRKTARRFNRVRSDEILVQLESRGGGGFTALPLPENF
jgi:hypothetical protein